jgi:hypothetical protein
VNHNSLGLSGRYSEDIVAPFIGDNVTGNSFNNQHVFVGDGTALEVKKVGKLRVKFEGRDQKTTDVLLEDVKFIPSLENNLFSLLIAMKKGHRFGQKGQT